MSSSSNVVQRSCGGRAEIGRPEASRITAPLAGHDVVQRRGLRAIDEALGELLEPLDRCAGREGVAPGPQDVVAVEGRVVRGQPVGAEQLVLDGGAAPRR